MKSSLLSGYRGFQVNVVKKLLLPFWIPREKHFRTDLLTENLPSKQGRIWFHAASVGELESLWPLIQLASQAGRELILTIFSESACSALAALENEMKSLGGNVLFCGHAPWEGEWRTALQKWKPSLFITAKYEAWPDLWVSLREEKIALAIVSARPRRSLQIARWFCETFSDGVPKLILLPCTQEDGLKLAKDFPNAEIHVTGEPRWDRVYARARSENKRARDLIQTFQSFPKPWGVLGSAWLNDLKFIRDAILNIKGTLWIVPHRVDAGSTCEIEAFFQALGKEVVCTSKLKERGANLKAGDPQCILVDEMGVLSELYSSADWVFIGGGFGAGIHSTIEPAFYGVPIAVGPNGTNRFSEVQELSSSGQLRILQNKQDLQNWIRFLQEESGARSHQNWVHEAQSRLGASQRIWSLLEKHAEEC